jgi:hypothetical protein
MLGPISDELGGELPTRHLGIRVRDKSGNAVAVQLQLVCLAKSGICFSFREGNMTGSNRRSLWASVVLAPLD